MNSKPWYESKTLWVNLIAAVSGFVLTFMGVDTPLDAEAQVGLLALVNLILRIITKKPISF